MTDAHIEDFLKINVGFDEKKFDKSIKSRKRAMKILMLLSAVLYITAIVFAFKNSYRPAYDFLITSYILYMIADAIHQRVLRSSWDAKEKLTKAKIKLLTSLI